MNVLLVEDDIQLNTTVRKFLELNGYKVSSVYDGDEAIVMLDTNEYGMYLVDINIPNINGLEIVKYIRQKDITTPIIMMTASLEIDNFVTAYDNGCNEYIKKPFHLKELEIRINSLFSKKKSDVLVVNDYIKYDFETNELSIKDKRISLRKKLDRLLQILLRNINHTVKTEDIINYVWENEIKDSYPLRQLISDLRKETIFEKNYIVSVVGVGYRFEV